MVAEQHGSQEEGARGEGLVQDHPEKSNQKLLKDKKNTIHKGRGAD